MFVGDLEGTLTFDYALNVPFALDWIMLHF